MKRTQMLSIFRGTLFQIPFLGKKRHNDWTEINPVALLMSKKEADLLVFHVSITDYEMIPFVSGRNTG